MNVSTFVATSGVQVGINANFFNLFDQFAPAGTPMQTYGLHISEGRVVAAQEDGTFSASLLFSANNHPTLIPTNWPPQSTDGAVTAVTGSYPLLLNGENLGHAYYGDPAHLHQINPRSALGLSADHRYLYLLTIDGRQPGYSDGAYDWETAAWLKVIGAWDAINLDGGGSSTLVMQDPNGNPRELNHPSSVYTYGVERTVASHFGIYAKSLPIIHAVVANPDDTAATITAANFSTFISPKLNSFWPTYLHPIWATFGPANQTTFGPALEAAHTQTECATFDFAHGAA